MPTTMMRAAFSALLLLVFLGCDGERIRLYHTEPLAPQLTREDVEAMNHMGAVVTETGVNFAVYSENATRLDVLLFDDPESEVPAQQFELLRIREGSPVWSLYVEGIGLGQRYGYVAWGPNWPFSEDWFPGAIDGFIADVDSNGNRFNPNKLLIDPYARALHRDHDWSKGSTASGPGRTSSTWAAGTKAVVVESTYEWSADETAWRAARAANDLPGHDWHQQIVYEVHPKGFTADPASNTDHPGTFRGIGEKAAYLAELGVTAVELLPVHEKPLDGGYWGYNTLNFFAPELSYSSRQAPEEVVDEFKWMVDQLHQAGLEVWLDVVYNHTGEGGLWRERIYQDDTSLDPNTDATFYNFDPHETAGLYTFRGLDDAAYYALEESGLTYWNNTGVGNQTRPNHTPMRRLIMDSLRFYVEEMHVDGFRFDLAGILGERDLDYNNWDDPANTVLQDISDADFIQDNNVRIVAEPWTAGGNYGSLIGAYPNATNGHGSGWGEWNARFRDWWRDFVNKDDWRLNTPISSEWSANADGGFVMTGSSAYYSHNGRKPWHSNNFVTVHDGFTMYDLFTYEEKVNGCGPLNPVCCDDPASAWCDRESGDNENRSRDWGMGPDGEATKRQMMRNLFTAMMISHGTPLLLGGDEWMRTQLGNNNAYSTQADNPWNWFKWGDWQQDPQRVRMHDFVSQVTQVRKDHEYAFAPAEYGEGAPFSWRNASNSGDPDWGSRNLMIHYWDPSYGPEIAVLINLERFPVEFTLPEGRTWVRLVDTQKWFDFEDPDNAADYFEQTGADPQVSWNISLGDAALTLSEATYGVAENTIVILETR